MTNERIDTAAHLGGLATGFICGLLLYRRLPIVPGWQERSRRVLATAGLSIGLVLAARTIADRVASRPEVRQASHEIDRASRSYNQLVTVIRQPILNVERIGQEMNKLLHRLEETDSPVPGEGVAVDRMITQLESDLDILSQAPRTDPELVPALDELITSERKLRNALKIIQTLLSHPDREPTKGPENFAQ